MFQKAILIFCTSSEFTSYIFGCLSIMNTVQLEYKTVHCLQHFFFVVKLHCFFVRNYQSTKYTAQNPSIVLLLDVQSQTIIDRVSKLLESPIHENVTTACIRDAFIITLLSIRVWKRHTVPLGWKIYSDTILDCFIKGWPKNCHL